MLHEHERLATRRMARLVRILIGSIHARRCLVHHSILDYCLGLFGYRNSSILPVGHSKCGSRSHVGRVHGGTGQGPTHHSRHSGNPYCLSPGVEVHLLPLYAGNEHLGAYYGTHRGSAGRWSMVRPDWKDSVSGGSNTFHTSIRANNR